MQQILNRIKTLENQNMPDVIDEVMKVYLEWEAPKNETIAKAAKEIEDNINKYLKEVYYDKYKIHRNGQGIFFDR